MKRTIGKLAKEVGVGVETVRYYQRRGLIRKPERSGIDPGSHHYEDKDVERLQFIRSAQTAGFTLTEIGELLQLDVSKDRPRARQLAEDRIAVLDRQIAEMQNARSALSKLAAACSTGAGKTCPIIASFLPSDESAKLSRASSRASN